MSSYNYSVTQSAIMYHKMLFTALTIRLWPHIRHSVRRKTVVNSWQFNWNCSYIRDPHKLGQSVITNVTILIFFIFWLKWLLKYKMPNQRPTQSKNQYLFERQIDQCHKWEMMSVCLHLVAVKFNYSSWMHLIEKINICHSNSFTHCCKWISNITASLPHFWIIEDKSIFYDFQTSNYQHW